MTRLARDVQIVQFRRVARLAYGDALPDAVRDGADFPVFASGGEVGRHHDSNTRAPVIVVGRKGSHGAVHWSDSPAFVIDTAYYVDNPTGANSLRWVYYVLQAANLRSLSQDVGVPGLARDQVHRMLIPRADPRRQRFVADFLDRECSAIGGADSELDELASNVARSMGQVAEERLLTLLDSAPLRKLAWDVSLLTGFAFKSSEFVHSSTEGVPLVRGINVTPRGLRWDSVVYWPWDRRSEARRFELAAGDLLVGLNRPWIRGGLRIGFVKDADLPALLLQRVGCLRVRPDASIDLQYVRAWLRTSDFKRRVGDASGVTFPMLDPGRMLAYRLPVPSLVEQRTIVREIVANEQRVAKVEADVLALRSGLREYREALIAEVVTGKLDVSKLSEARMAESLAAVREGERPEVLSS